MNESQTQRSGSPGLSADEKRELAARIIASRHFARASQLKEFLLFIVERAVQDDPAPINEVEIGKCVLRRNQPDFDPNTDNIVRVQARHLRRKLDEYFNAEGRDEPVVLTVPTGGYAARFEPRTSPPAAASPVKRRAPALSRRAGVAILVVLLAAAGGVALRAVRQNRSAAPPPAAVTAAPDILWSRIASTGRKTYIVLSDGSLNLLQGLLGRQLTLSEYLASGYPRNTASGLTGYGPALLEEIANHPRTSLTSAIVGSELQAAAKRNGVDTTLRFPRNIDIRDFKSENFILAGSRFSIPWVALLEERLDFTLGGGPTGLDVYIRNKSPRANEGSIYRPVLSSGKAQTDYAAIAIVPNLGGTGVIVLLQGSHAMGTEAAAEMITGAANSPLHELLRTQSRDEPPHVEVLIRVTGVAGAPARLEVVATRPPSPRAVK